MQRSSYSNKNSGIIAHLIPGLNQAESSSSLRSSVVGSGSLRYVLRQTAPIGTYSRAFESRDGLKAIDWRAAGRFSQLLVREDYSESPFYCDYFVDLRESMYWPTEEEVKEFSLCDTSKAELALRLCLHQSFIHLGRGDRLRWFLILNDPHHSNMYSVANLSFKSRGEIQDTFDNLEKAGFDLLTLESKISGREGVKPSDLSMKIAELSGNKSLVRILSDCMSEPFNELAQICGAVENRMQFFHLMHSSELNLLNFSPDNNYSPLLPPHSTELGGEHLFGNNFLQKKVSGWREDLEKIVLTSGGQFLSLNEQTSIDSYLETLKVLSL